MKLSSARYGKPECQNKHYELTSALISLDKVGFKVLNRLKRDERSQNMYEPAGTFVELIQACGLEYY